MKIPEGWPTAEMVSAFKKVFRQGSWNEGVIAGIKAALAAAPTPPVPTQLAAERFPEMRDSGMSLEERIEAAIKRIASGHAAMRIPVEATDPDMVLQDCLIELRRIRSTLPAQEDEPVYQVSFSGKTWTDTTKEGFDSWGAENKRRALYAAPQDDKLRKAAEEVSSGLALWAGMNNTVPEWLREKLYVYAENLRAALEGK